MPMQTDQMKGSMTFLQILDTWSDQPVNWLSNIRRLRYFCLTVVRKTMLSITTSGCTT